LCLVFVSIAGTESPESREEARMIEILRTNDVVALSLAEALLAGAGIECFVADRHMSVLEGSIGAFQRRVLVDRDVEVKARRTLAEGGLGDYLRESPA
jgi:hypothetical protein